MSMDRHLKSGIERDQKMSDEYYVLSVSPDGIYFTKHTLESLKESYLNPEENGSYTFISAEEFGKGLQDYETAWHGENQVVIIKGKVVVPKPVEVVKEYRLEDE